MEQQYNSSDTTTAWRKILEVAYKEMECLLYIYKYIFLYSTSLHSCPVGSNCRIHRQHLCRGGRPPQTSIRYMTLNNLMGRLQQCWSFGECIAPMSTRAWSESTQQLQIEQNYVLMLHWIKWNTTVLTFELRTYAKLIVWNRIVFDNETIKK